MNGKPTCQCELQTVIVEAAWFRRWGHIPDCPHLPPEALAELPERPAQARKAEREVTMLDGPVYEEDVLSQRSSASQWFFWGTIAGMCFAFLVWLTLWENWR